MKQFDEATSNSAMATGEDLLAWLAGAGARTLRPQTVHQYASCVRHVLAAQPEGLRTPLRHLDLDVAGDAFRRSNAGPGARAPQTVNTYISSFKAAVRTYLRDADDEHRGPNKQKPALRSWDFPLRKDLTIELALPVDLRP